MTARVDWAAGSARIGLDRLSGPSRLSVAVCCRVDRSPETHLALLDTGAQWSLVGGGLARSLLAGNGSGQSIRYSTRMGLLEGTLERLCVELLADPGHGVDLTVEATVFLAPDWDGPVVLGTRGLLERIRLELDPDQTGEDSWWSFALSDR